MTNVESDNEKVSLNILFQGSVVQEFSLAEKISSIGRDPGNDLQLDHPSVSRRHAKISQVFNEIFVEDAGSTNGTLLNGRRISKHVVRPGDTIAVGAYEIELKPAEEMSSGAAEEEVDLDRTMVMTPNDITNAAAKAVSQAKKPASVAGEASVKVIDGAETGKELPMTRSLLTLGRPGVGLAVIAKRSDGHYLLHVGGDQMPSVNGQKVGRSGVRLTSGDKLTVSGVGYEFILSGAVSEGARAI